MVDRIRTAMLHDHRRVNSEIASELGLNIDQVRTVRLQMEDEQLIPVWRGNDPPVGPSAYREVTLSSDRPGRGGRPVGFKVSDETRRKMLERSISSRQRDERRLAVRDALLKDHRRSNARIGKLLSPPVGIPLVGSIRRAMERDGEIPAWKSGGRWGRPVENEVTYIIQGVQSGRFKVGASTDVQRRIGVLQSHSPDDLVIRHTIPGGDWERILHERLEAHHSHHEWFEHSPETDRIIAETIAEALGIDK